MNNEIIVVKQLPIIQEQLQQIKASVTERVNLAKSLVCTEDNVKEIKKIRAELNNEFKELDEKRKEVKRAIMAPYDSFEASFKSCVTEIYIDGVTDLAEKINAVENELKEQKAREVLDYFNEYRSAVESTKGYLLNEFVTFERVALNVTLSASMPSLKKQVATFIDRVCGDLSLIETQEHKEEILYEYKQSLNVSEAITSVANRYKAIEEEKKREEERKAKAQAASEVVAKVKTVTRTLTPPIMVEATPIEEEPTLTIKLTVKGTREQLRALKEFLNKGGYEYNG